MKLYLKNIAGIKEADLDFHGITVVTGDNSTGKSTIGKSLYYMFDSFRDIDFKVNNDIVESIRDLLLEEYRKNHFTDFGNMIEILYELSYVLFVNYNNENFDENVLKKCLYDIAINFVFDNKSSKYQLTLSTPIKHFIKNLEENTLKRIYQYLSNDKEELKHGILMKDINNGFSGDLKNQYSDDDTFELKLILQGKQIALTENKAVSEQKITNKAIYIDDPNIIKYIRPNNYYHSSISMIDSASTLLTIKPYESSLIKLLSETKETKVSQDLENKKSLDKINTVLNGSFNYKGNIETRYKGKNIDISISNLATGMKTFLIIKTLILNGAIKNKDVLILDEPEVHLHPKWQLTLAETIVVLQKELNLTILINTHSPYFVEAIEVYSKEHNVGDKTKFYESKVIDNQFHFENVTTDIKKIYEKMSEPFITLEEVVVGGREL